MAFITLFFYNFSFKGRKWNLNDKQFRHNFEFYDKSDVGIWADRKMT